MTIKNKRNKVLVCLNYTLTENQKAELYILGYDTIVYLAEIDPILSAKLMHTPADERELQHLAYWLGNIVKNAGVSAVVLPIGSPAFMYLFTLRMSCQRKKQVFFSHSDRVSREVVKEDGSVEKMSEFRHVRFLKFQADGNIY